MKRGVHVAIAIVKDDPDVPEGYASARSRNALEDGAMSRSTRCVLKEIA